MNIIGRVAEKLILKERLESGQSELIAVFGRRRVGKTYLIRTFCEKVMAFEFTGIHEATITTQLENFSLSLQQYTKSNVALRIPLNWLQAFVMLDAYLNTLPKKKAAVIFFDEFPWIATRKAGFLQAFDHWWNTSASKKAHLKVIICGSAASWMIEKVINNRGGLHNRVTQKIRLLPFTLNETQAYLKSNNVVLEQYSQLQLYMALGGIPHYLRNVRGGESVVQIIDRLCFLKDGPLRTEFDNLYKSLFAQSENHEKVVRALANRGSGLNRNELIKECAFTSGGTTTRILKELEESGFIASYIPFTKNANERMFKLSDEYSLFYLKFIEHAKDRTDGAWQRQFNKPAYLSWCGFAFESVCQKHVLQIKRKLGIEGVLTNTATWRQVPVCTPFRQ